MSTASRSSASELTSRLVGGAATVDERRRQLRVRRPEGPGRRRAGDRSSTSTARAGRSTRLVEQLQGTGGDRRRRASATASRPSRARRRAARRSSSRTERLDAWSIAVVRRTTARGDRRPPRRPQRRGRDRALDPEPEVPAELSGRHEVRRALAGEHGDRTLARELRHPRPRRAATREPMCGSSTVRGAASRRGCTSGSRSNTSRPAAKIAPCLERDRRAPPRRRPARVRCSRAPRSGFISASRRASMRWRVASVSGTCSDTTSRLARAGRRGRRPSPGARCRGACGAAPASRSRRRGAPTAWPMRPKPTSPSVAPCTSRPRYWLMPQPVPAAGAQVGLGLGRQPRRSEDQQEREVGGRLVEHAGRVAHRDAVLARGARRRRCRSRRRRSRRRAAGRRPAASTSASIRSVSRHTIASTSAAAATSSSCVNGDVVVALRRARGRRRRAGRAPPSGSRRVTRTRAMGAGRSVAACSRPRPRPCTPTAKQKQWIGAWSLTGRRLCTRFGGMCTRSPWRDLALLAVDRHEPAARR